MRIATVCSFFLVWGCSNNKSDGRDDSKRDIARLAVMKYTHEAFPQWANTHPGKACPSSLTELYDYMNARDGSDPWGNPYHMLCGGSLPPGAKGFAVYSLGPDGKDGTCDDVQSWDEHHACK